MNESRRGKFTNMSFFHYELNIRSFIIVDFLELIIKCKCVIDNDILVNKEFSFAIKRIIQPKLGNLPNIIALVWKRDLPSRKELARPTFDVH